MSANNRGYLLGAGFSMAVSAEGDVSDEFRMPSMQQLSKAVQDDVKQSRPRLPNLTSTEEAAYEAFNNFMPVLDEAPEPVRAKFGEVYRAFIDLNAESYLPGAGTPLVASSRVVYESDLISGTGVS